MAAGSTRHIEVLLPSAANLATSVFVSRVVNSGAVIKVVAR